MVSNASIRYHDSLHSRATPTALSLIGSGKLPRPGPMGHPPARGCRLPAYAVVGDWGDSIEQYITPFAGIALDTGTVTVWDHFAP